MLNKEEIKRNFSQSAKDYEKHAILQKELAGEVFALAEGLKPTCVLDIGCGTGYLTLKLAKIFPQAKVIGIDIAPGMIEVAGSNSTPKNLDFKIGDAENLSFLQPDFDLIVSNASFQWMNARKVLAGVQRILRPKGRLIFTTSGPRTLYELRKSGFRVNKFISFNEWIELLDDKFKIKRLESRIIEQRFGGVKELIYHLKEIGAHSADSNLNSGLNVLGSFKTYRKEFSPDGSHVTATYEAIIGFCDKI